MKWVGGLFSWFISTAVFCQDLNPELIRLLIEAQETGAFNVDVLVRKVEGRKEFVVQLGEGHVKGKEASLIGKKILNHVDLIGKEGFQSERYWGHQIFIPVIVVWPRELLNKLQVPGLSEHSMTMDVKKNVELVELESQHYPSLLEQSAVIYMSGLALLYPPVLLYKLCQGTLGRLGGEGDEKNWAQRSHQFLKEHESWHLNTRKYYHAVGLPLFLVNLLAMVYPQSTIHNWNSRKQKLLNGYRD